MGGEGGGPLSTTVGGTELEAWLGTVRGDGLAIALALATYIVGGLIMFPVMALIAVSGVLYGPLTGFLVSIAGSTLSAAVGYWAGHLLGRRTVHQLSGGRIDRINRQLARRGILSTTIIRLLPLAPFTLINLAAGASHISFRDYILGTVLGMAPGIVAITLLSSNLVTALQAPSVLNVAILVALLLILVAGMIWSWRHFVRRRA